MIINKAFKVELDPNNEQRTLLLKCAGVARFSWNWALQRRMDEYAATGTSPNYFVQNPQLNAVKRQEFPWMLEVSKAIPESSIRDLDKAYQNFFRLVKQGKKGFPRFKSRKNGIGSFRMHADIRVFNSAIQLPRLGKIRLKEHGYIPTEGIKILSATCSEKAGRWFVGITCEVEIPEPEVGTGDPIGIDLGIKTLVVTSDGREFANPKALGKAQNKLRRAQRILSRRKKGSQNRDKAKQRVAKIHYRIANIRRDTLHQITSAIVKAKDKPSIIVLEDLNVHGMVKNHKLARAISDVGFAELRRQIEYKSKWHGIEVLIAPRFFASSKTCHVCGTINNELTLANRNWYCDCGAYHDRDFNAAKNLASLALPLDRREVACGDRISPALAGNDRRSRNHARAGDQWRVKTL